jgi:SAM-dependent methyltransferase
MVTETRRQPFVHIANAEALREWGSDVSPAAFVLADANRSPFRDDAFDGVLAAGLITHLAGPLDALRRLAGITRVGGHLALFHPVGRATLAARHGHELRPDDIRESGNVTAAFAATGWRPVEIDDGESRYLAVARRVR